MLCCTHNLAYARKPILACVMPLPKNPKFLFVCFVPAFTCLFCLALFYIYVLGPIGSLLPLSHACLLSHA